MSNQKYEYVVIEDVNPNELAVVVSQWTKKGYEFVQSTPTRMLPNNNVLNTLFFKKEK